ncbi:MAG: hypothetical protein QGH74_01785 [Candidatus Brocadiia bacterium]|nr:hypothetical protein [Candidatus Brocadiia bacterium]
MLRKNYRTARTPRARITAVLALVALALATAGVVLWGVRARPGQAPQGAAKSWLEAVAGDDMLTALALAEEIAGGEAGEEVHPFYLEIARRESFRETFFSGSFDGWDYQRWRHALFFHSLAREITAGRGDEIEALFSAVRERIDREEDLSAPPEALWPYRVWQRGYGVCDRQVWVLSELATQLGYETQVLQLRDPQTGVSPHTVCEIRKGRDQVWLADPYLNVLLPGTSAESLAADPARLQSVWPGKDALHAAMAGSEMFTPAFPQDYRPRNQRLARRLREVLGEQCPRFGEDPAERMRRYYGLLELTTGAEPRFKMIFWGFPWWTLRVDMFLRGGGAEPSAGRPKPGEPGNPAAHSEGAAPPRQPPEDEQPVQRLRSTPHGRTGAGRLDVPRGP